MSVKLPLFSFLSIRKKVGRKEERKKAILNILCDPTLLRIIVERKKKKIKKKKIKKKKKETAKQLEWNEFCKRRVCFKWVKNRIVNNP